MPTIAEQLTQLQTDKQTLVDNLVAKGVEATSDETFTSLVPKVADIQAGGGGTEDFEINDASYLFYGVGRNNLYDILSPKLKNVVKAERMFYENTGFETIDLRNVDFSKCTSLKYFFSVSTSNRTLKYIYLPNDFSLLTDMQYFLNYRWGITNLDLSNITASLAVNCNNAFASTRFYGSLKLPKMKVSNATRMFNGTGLYKDETLNEMIELDLENLDFSECTTLYYMFGQISTETIKHSNFDCSKVENLSDLFIMANNLVNMCQLKNLGKGYTRKSANYSSYTLKLSNAGKLNTESIINILNGLYDLNLTYDVANGGTLYTQQVVVGATHMATLEASEEGQQAIADATAKGWVVS